MSNEQQPSSRVRPIRNRVWFRMLIYLALFYIAWCLTLYFYQDKMLFPADVASDPLERLYSHSTVELTREIEGGGKVVAWYIPAVNPDRPAPLVVFFHGNAEIIDRQFEIINGYQRLGFCILLPEYRGYGRADGKPSQAVIVGDSAYFYDLVCKRADVDASRVVFHGRSLGGGVAAQLAAQRKPRLLILQSTFSSAASMAHRYFAPGLLVKNPFLTDRVLTDLDCPLLLFHGSDDNIIPVWHGRALRDRARNVTYVEYKCGHNDFPGQGNNKLYWQEIERFLAANGIIGHAAS